MCARLGTGTFFCLWCKGDRSYELREWREVPHVFFIPLSSSGGKFVLCTTCKLAFDPECLNESSTAELHELEVDVPGFACRPLLGRPTNELSQNQSHGLSQYLGHDSLDHAEAPTTPSAPEMRGQGHTLSARSRSRRH